MFTEKYIETLTKKISKQGFALMEKYNGPNRSYRFECEKGHKWRAEFQTVRDRTLHCPICKQEERKQEVRKQEERKQEVRKQEVRKQEVRKQQEERKQEVRKQQEERKQEVRKQEERKQEERIESIKQIWIKKGLIPEDLITGWGKYNFKCIICGSVTLLVFDSDRTKNIRQRKSIGCRKCTSIQRCKNKRDDSYSQEIEAKITKIKEMGWTVTSTPEKKQTR